MSDFRRWASRVCRTVRGTVGGDSELVAAFNDGCEACAKALLTAIAPIGREEAPPITFTQAELDTIVEAAVLTERRAVVAFVRSGECGSIDPATRLWLATLFEAGDHVGTEDPRG